MARQVSLSKARLSTCDNSYRHGRGDTRSSDDKFSTRGEILGGPLGRGDTTAWISSCLDGTQRRLETRTLLGRSATRQTWPWVFDMSYGIGWRVGRALHPPRSETKSVTKSPSGVGNDHGPRLGECRGLVHIVGKLTAPQPFLSSLGIPIHVSSFIWIAGPLSGALVQPYVSVLSDRLRSSWGRRRPFILFGAICTTISMILLPWTGEIADSLIPGPFHESYDKRNTAIRSCIAGLLVWALNISIQPMQVGMRALVVDSCPPQQQIQATTYITTITAIGNILGYTFGFIDLPKMLPWSGSTQYQCVFLLASLIFMVAVTITCFVVQERPSTFRTGAGDQSRGVLTVFRQVWVSARLMPRDMKSVCLVQFCSWLGWFPFLFYITT